MTEKQDSYQKSDTGEPQVSEDRTIIPSHPSRIAVTGEPQVYHCPITHCSHLIHLPGDGVIIAWLNEKTNKSRSWKTHVSYHSTALAVRAALYSHGYDLFTDLSSDEDYARYVLVVQQWANQRSTKAKRQGTITPATYNNRLAIVGSLFDYAKRTRLYRGDNPVDAIERRKIEDQENAEPLEATEVMEYLTKIDRTTRVGKRDYALIGVALQTAQRGQALADMHIRDLTWMGPRLKIYFPATKGARSDTKLLEVETSGTLATYLRSYYGEEWLEKQDAPVWVSFSNNDSQGHKLSIQAIEEIYAKRLGTSKSHVTRHTAAYALKELQVSASDIQELLQHQNIATTDTYMRKRLKKVESKHGRKLEDAFGIRATHDEDVG